MSEWTKALHDYWKAHCVDNSWKHVSLEISQDSMLAFIEHIEFQETLINYWEDLAKSHDREFMLCKHTSALMTRLHDEKCVKIDALTARIAELESRLARLEEVGDRLAKHPYPMTDAAHIDSGEYCVYCHKSSKFEHESHCPVTLWQQAKEGKE